MSKNAAASRLLVVIGDSISFYGQDEILGLEHPATLGYQIADRLTTATGTTWKAVNASHGGRTAFDARKLLRRDPLFRALIAEADVVFLQACGKDGIVTPFPRPARLVIGRIPKRYRGRVVRWLKPRIAKVTSRQFPLTPSRLLAKSWRGLVQGIRSVNPDAVLVTASPACEYGPNSIITFPDDWRAPGGHVAKVRAMAAAEGVPHVDLIAMVDEWFGDADLLPDYLHWPPAMHAFAADRIAPVVVDELVAAGRTTPVVDEPVLWPTAV